MSICAEEEIVRYMHGGRLRMKKMTVVLIMAVVIAAGSVQAYGASVSGSAKKLGRGVANVVTSPIGILEGIQDTMVERGAFAGFTWGIFQGVVNVVKRVVVGTYEIITFPVPFPRDYQPILTDPEFYFQEKRI